MQSFKQYFEESEDSVYSAAKAAGFNVGPLWHQTKRPIKIFDISNKYTSSGGALEYLIPNGVYLKNTKDKIGVPGDIQLKLFAKINNPLIVDDREKLSMFLRKNMNGFSEIEDDLIGFRKTELEKLKTDPNIQVSAKNLQNEYNEKAKQIKRGVTSFFDKTKFDGIVLNNDRGVSTTIGFTPEHIKSAEDVTLDDQGNEIPLSQRFDTSTQDIRY